jgi:H+-translocating NAD(P) transhydrogenase
MLGMFRRPTDVPEYSHVFALPAIAIPAGYLGALAYTGGANPALHDMAGLAAAALCIGSVAGLSSQSTARVGNIMGMLGIGTGACGDGDGDGVEGRGGVGVKCSQLAHPPRAGVLATLGGSGASHNTLLQMGGALAAGGLAGTVVAQRVQITVRACMARGWGGMWRAGVPHASSARVSLVERAQELPQLVAAFHSFVGAAAVLTAYSSYLHHAPTGDIVVDPAVTLHLSTDWAAAVIGAMTTSGSLVAFGKLQGFLASKPLQYAARDMVSARSRHAPPFRHLHHPPFRA